MVALVKNPAGLSRPELASTALVTSGWNRSELAKVTTEEQVREALEYLKWSARQLKYDEPRGMVDGKRGPQTNKIMQNLRMIGAKINPAMAKEQVDVWITAMTIALSDLPYQFLAYATVEALHVPMSFLNEVEKVVRDKADIAKEKHQLATDRLRNLRTEIRNAAKPKLPPREATEITQEEINALTPDLLRMGFDAGWISQEQRDIAQNQEENT